MKTHTTYVIRVLGSGIAYAGLVLLLLVLIKGNDVLVRVIGG